MADIKKNAKQGNMVCLKPRLLSPFAELAERLQNPRQGPRPDPTIHAKVHADAGSTAGSLAADADIAE
jgi:hypothetical protein